MGNLTVMNMLFVLQNFNIDKCHTGFYGSLFSFDFAFCVFEAKCLSLSFRKVFNAMFQKWNFVKVSDWNEVFLYLWTVPKVGKIWTGLKVGKIISTAPVFYISVWWYLFAHMYLEIFVYSCVSEDILTFHVVNMKVTKSCSLGIVEFTAFFWKTYNKCVNVVHLYMKKVKILARKAQKCLNIIFIACCIVPLNTNYVVDSGMKASLLVHGKPSFEIIRKYTRSPQKIIATQGVFTQ